MIKRALSSIVGLGIVGLFLVDALITWKVFALYPSNHCGYDIRWVYVPSLAVLLICLAGLICCKLRGWLPIAGLCIAAVSCVGVFVLDHYNMLVEYEIWLARGMPAFGN